MLRIVVQTFVDFVAPPRRTERLVRTLALEELAGLQGGGGLPYRDPRITALVWEIKYFGSARAAALAGALLRDEILACAAEELGVPLLVPVPMHPERLRERGHNQTELLCRAALPGLGGVEYAPRALARVRHAPRQQGLERAKRLKNVRGSMRAGHVVAGRACIVVDDVATTGATLEEAERALRAAGARAVHCIALARS